MLFYGSAPRLRLFSLVRKELRIEKNNFKTHYIGQQLHSEWNVSTMYQIPMFRPKASPGAKRRGTRVAGVLSTSEVRLDQGNLIHSTSIPL